MPELWRRRLMAAEITFLCLPTVLVMPVLAWLSATVEVPDAERLEIGLLTLLLFCCGLVAIASGLRLARRFYVGGVAYLRTSPRYIWRLAHVGAALCVVGIGTFFVPWNSLGMVGDDNWLPPVISQIRGLSIALPMLVPYCHLALERCSGRNLTNDWSNGDG